MVCPWTPWPVLRHEPLIGTAGGDPAHGQTKLDIGSTAAPGSREGRGGRRGTSSPGTQEGRARGPAHALRPTGAWWLPHVPGAVRRAAAALAGRGAGARVLARGGVLGDGERRAGLRGGHHRVAAGR